jgi:hypothetical protein
VNVHTGVEVALMVGVPLAVVAVPIVAVLVHRRRRLGWVEWAATAAVCVVLVAGWWRWASPVVIDGVQCMDASAMTTVTPDASLYWVEGVEMAAERAACADLARRIVFGWAAVMGGAVACWIWLLRSRWASTWLARRSSGTQTE